MTEQPDTAAIRARAAAATGPNEGWGWRHFGDDPENLCRVVWYPSDPAIQWQVIADEIYEPADAEFIARARTDVPTLCDALDATRTERDAATCDCHSSIWDKGGWRDRAERAEARITELEAMVAEAVRAGLTDGNG